jgi:hypothetical protein
MNITKLYTEYMKYTGEEDSFDYKLVILNDRCGILGIHDDYSKAAIFSIMLTGNALAYFYTLNRDPAGPYGTFTGICKAIRDHYEGPETHITALNIWNGVDMKSMKEKHPEKSTIEQFETMLETLNKLQYKLQPTLSFPLPSIRSLKVISFSPHLCESIA